MVKTNSSVGFYLRILVVSIFIAILGLGPSPHAISGLMVNAYQSASSGDYLNAARDLAGITSYYPGRVDLNVKAGRYAFQAGDPEATIQYLERPGTLAHLTVDDWILLGDAYNQTGDSSRSEAIWKDVTKLGDSNQVFQRLADLYIKQKDYVTAVSYMQKQLSINPADTQLYYQVGLLYAVTDPIKALPFLAQATEIDPAHASDAGTLHDEIRTANLFDQPEYILLSSGRQLASMGNWEYAGEAFKRATDLNPKYADAWAFLGEAQQQIASPEISAFSNVGLSELTRALEEEPDSVLANTFMGLYWERHQDYSQAQHYLERSIAVNPSDPYLYSELGNILSKSGDLPAAQVAYESAIKITPQDPLFYCLLAQFALENQIQIRELALPAVRQALLLDTHDANSLDVMAQVMLMLQDFNSAERYATGAIQADPNFAPAYLHLGTAYLYLSEPDLAYKWLSLAKNVDPNSWVAAQSTRMLDYYFP